MEKVTKWVKKKKSGGLGNMLKGAVEKVDEAFGEGIDRAKGYSKKKWEQIPVEDRKDLKKGGVAAGVGYGFGGIPGVALTAYTVYKGVKIYKRHRKKKPEEGQE